MLISLAIKADIICLWQERVSCVYGCLEEYLLLTDTAEACTNRVSIDLSDEVI